MNSKSKNSPEIEPLDRCIEVRFCPDKSLQLKLTDAINDFSFTQTIVYDGPRPIISRLVGCINEMFDVCDVRFIGADMGVLYFSYELPDQVDTSSDFDACYEDYWANGGYWD